MRLLLNVQNPKFELFICFRSVFQEHVVLSEILQKAKIMKQLYDSIKPNEAVHKDITYIGTSLQVNGLKSQDGKIVLVANTHLYYSPDGEHIRLIQLQIAFLYIEDVIKKLKHKVR